MRAMALLLALGAVGCGRPYECLPGDPPQGVAHAMVSPAPGSTVGGPWTPVIAEVDSADAPFAFKVPRP